MERKPCSFFPANARSNRSSTYSMSLFRDRRSDIEYVEERLLRALAGKKEHGFLSIQGKTILIARDMSPADLTKINRENLSAIVTDTGGRTSHIAIIAR